MKLLIYGAGGFGKEILDLAKGINNFVDFYDEAIMVDNLYAGKKCNGGVVLSADEAFIKISPKEAYFVIAMGEPKFRKKYFDLFLEKGYTPKSLVHPSADIGSDTKIGAGVVVQKGVIITTDVMIEDNVCIQYNATIAHECTVGKDSFIASGATISGNVHIGKGTYIAIDVPIRQGVTIGDNTTIGMGSCVSRNVPSNAVTTGNPLRILRDMDGYNVFK